METLSFVLFAVLYTTLLVATNSAVARSVNVGLTIPDECRREGFCTIKPEGYEELEERMNQLLPKALITIGNRDGGPLRENLVENDEDNCPSKSVMVTAYTHYTEKNTKLDVIVNTKLLRQDYMQVVCAYDKMKYRHQDDGVQCFEKLGLSSLGMKFSCQQYSATRTFVIFDPDVEAIRTKNFTIPVSCSCRITSSNI